MNFPPGDPGGVLLLALWILLWATGGFWLAGAAFRLAPHERLMVGIGIGWVIETLIANLLSHFLLLPLAAWLAATIILVAGAGLAVWREHGWPALVRGPVSLWQAGTFVALTYFLTRIAQGLNFSDDYAAIPTLSLIAAGQTPPHFALDPKIAYGFDYLLLLFASQIVRIGGLLPWTALDLARGASIALAVVLAFLWVWRLTRSQLGGFCGALVTLFGSGTRWMLLFLPERILNTITNKLKLIGSGASSGSYLAEALVSRWGIEGTGPFPFPFAYANGIVGPGFLALGSAVGQIGAAITFPLFLTFNRWRGWPGAVVTALLIGAGGLLGDTGPGLSLTAWLVVSLLFLAKILVRSFRGHGSDKSRDLPFLLRQSIHSEGKSWSTLWQWWLVLLAGSLLGALQSSAPGGVLSRWLSEWSIAGQASLPAAGLKIASSTSVISSQLGAMDLRDPYQLMVAAFEIGPVLLALPLIIAFGWKAFRAGRWLEASAIAGGLISFVMLLAQFAGLAEVRNISYLYGWIVTCMFFATPVVWMWARHRSMLVKGTACLLGVTLVFGGMVIFGSALTAAQQPGYAPFIKDLDIPVMKTVWNQLPPDALVFDTNPYRAPTVTGRYIDAGLSWFETKPAYRRLKSKPILGDLRTAGYDYVYIDQDSWKGMPTAARESLGSSCVKIVAQAENPLGFRRLLDIHGCP